MTGTEWVLLFLLLATATTLAVALARGSAKSKLQDSRIQVADAESRRYRDLFENARDILYTLTPDGRIRTINRSIERFTGRPRRDFIGRPLAELAADEDAGQLFAEHLSNVVQHRAAGTIQIRVRVPSAEGELTTNPTGESTSPYRVLELCSHGVPETGAVEQIQGTARDVTMRKQLELSKLETEQLEAIGRLSGGIAHDFNNILTIIRGHAEYVREQLTLETPTVREGTGGDDRDWSNNQGSDKVESIDCVLAASKRAELLTLQLMGLSRRRCQDPELLDLHELVHATIKSVALVLPEDITCSESLMSGTPRVFADRGSVEQILLNLALNARDAMPDGGTLKIETRGQTLTIDTEVDGQKIEAGRYVVLSVTDTGHGMDEATAARAFKPFFTTKRPGRGTGLGLATVQSAMTRMGGHIMVSSSPGSGACFTMYLPWSDLVPRPRRSQEATRGTEIILLVEDEPHVRSVMERAMRLAGYVVLCADSAESALRHHAPRLGDIDAMVSDVDLTGMSGADLAREIRESRPTLPVVFLSGLPPRTDPSRSAPITRFAKKPITPRELMQTVRALLDTSEAGRPGQTSV